MLHACVSTVTVSKLHLTRQQQIFSEFRNWKSRVPRWPNAAVDTEMHRPSGKLGDRHIRVWVCITCIVPNFMGKGERQAAQ